MGTFSRLGAAIIVAAAMLFAASPASADTFLGSYTARISAKDHLASDGYRLRTAAQMIRQDRANWHRFGRGDFEDEDDPWFVSSDARAWLERMLNQSGAMSQQVRRAIVNGQPVIQVSVYRNSVRVRILGY